MHEEPEKEEPVRDGMGLYRRGHFTGCDFRDDESSNTFFRVYYEDGHAVDVDYLSVTGWRALARKTAQDWSKSTKWHTMKHSFEQSGGTHPHFLEAALQEVCAKNFLSDEEQARLNEYASVTRASLMTLPGQRIHPREIPANSNVPITFQVAPDFTGLLFGEHPWFGGITRVQYHEGIVVEVAYLSRSGWKRYENLDELSSAYNQSIQEAISIGIDEVQKIITDDEEYKALGLSITAEGNAQPTESIKSAEAKKAQQERMRLHIARQEAQQLAEKMREHSPLAISQDQDTIPADPDKRQNA